MYGSAFNRAEKRDLLFNLFLLLPWQSNRGERECGYNHTCKHPPTPPSNVSPQQLPSSSFSLKKRKIKNLKTSREWRGRRMGERGGGVICGWVESFFNVFFFFCLGNRANWDGKFAFCPFFSRHFVVCENVEAEQDFKKESVTFACWIILAGFFSWVSKGNPRRWILQFTFPSPGVAQALSHTFISEQDEMERWDSSFSPPSSVLLLHTQSSQVWKNTAQPSEKKNIPLMAQGRVDSPRNFRESHVCSLFRWPVENGNRRAGCSATI